MARLYGTFLGEVLHRASKLVRRPWVLFTLGLVAVGGSALATLPLFGVPGYELAGAMSLAIGLLGGIVGVSSAWLERKTVLEGDTGISLGPTAAAMIPFGASFVLCLVAACVPGIVAALKAWLLSACSPFAHLGFYPLLVVPSAALASAFGVLCGLATRRRRSALGLYVLGVLLSAVWTAWPLVFGPQVFAFNHFGGYLPGPLYDEALSLRPSLYWFRTQTLMWTWASLALSVALVDARVGILGRPKFRPGAYLTLLLCVLGIVGIERNAAALGIRTSDAALSEALGGVRTTDTMVIHFPRGKKREDVDRLVRDLEFRHAQLKAFLGDAPSKKIRVWVYRSEQEKARWVGASRTQFAKPWRLELHLNDSDFPDPTLKHELAHVMAAPFGARPFGATARVFGLFPVIGIIEGFAVAADNPMDQLTLHEWVAAMRKHKLAPNIRSLLKPTGFYANAASRAYTVAGSFIRFLADTYGTEKLRTLYLHGDFEQSYGRSLNDLAEEWERFLDGLPLDESAVSVAFARFREGSLFARPCAREVASLKAKAEETLQGDPEEASRLFKRCREIQPDEPGHYLGEARALMKMDQSAQALELLKTLEPKVEPHPQLKAETFMAEADASWLLQRPEATAQLLEKVISLKPSASVLRTAHVKLSASDGSAVSAAVWGYFQPGQDELKLLRLREAVGVAPDDVALNYLLGRRLEQAHAPNLAVAYLTRALMKDLPDSLRRESLRLKVQAEYESGDCNAVTQTLGELPGYGTAFKEWMLEWKARCEFELKKYPKLLSPEEPFR
jgi:tetratricopeptide (TPR) repeat protein